MNTKACYKDSLVELASRFRRTHQPAVNTGKIMLKKICLLIALASAGSAFAQDATCTANAAEKKLAGAAKNSFLKKCEKDAAARCEIASQEKKLAGAAKSSFSKKCVKDAVGA